MPRFLLLHAGASLTALALFVVGALAAIPLEIAFIRAMGITELTLSSDQIPSGIVVRGGACLAIPVLGAQAAAIADTWARRETPPLPRWALFAVAPMVAAFVGLALRAVWLYVGITRSDVLLDEGLLWSLDSFELTRWMVRLGLLAAVVQAAVVAWAGRAARSGPSTPGRSPGPPTGVG